MLYGRLGRYAEAHDYWQCAYEQYQRLGKTLAIAGCQLNRSFLYNLAGDHQAALTTAHAVNHYLAERTITAPVRLRAMLDQSMAEAYLGLGDLQAANAAAQAALAHEEIGLFPDTYRTLAEIQLRTGQLATARTFITAAIDAAQQNQDRYLEAYAWRVAAQIHQADQNQAAAHQAAARASTMFTDLQLSHEVAKIPPLRLDSAVVKT